VIVMGPMWRASCCRLTRPHTCRRVCECVGGMGWRGRLWLSAHAPSQAAGSLDIALGSSHNLLRALLLGAHQPPTGARCEAAQVPRTNTRTCAQAHTHTHTRAHAHACTHTRMHTHIHTRARTHARTHTHTCTHAYTHTHTQTPLS